MTTKILDNTVISASIKEITCLDFIERCSKIYPVETSLEVFRETERGENALLVNPATGKRWTEDKLRQNLLSKYAKMVWPPYWPYSMRHWAATARCIEWKKDNTVLYRVKYWLGHKQLDQTLRYLDLAKLYDQGKGSWLSRALKQHKKHVWGMREFPGKERTSAKTPRFVLISPRENNGPTGITRCFLKGFSLEAPF